MTRRATTGLVRGHSFLCAFEDDGDSLDLSLTWLQSCPIEYLNLQRDDEDGLNDSNAKPEGYGLYHHLLLA